MNQADEVESIGHGRELAPDSIPGKKESAIEHGDELPTHILSVRVRLAELISTEIQGLACVGCGFRIEDEDVPGQRTRFPGTFFSAKILHQDPGMTA